MRILPWSLSAPASGSRLIVPRLPFPYLLRSAFVLFPFGVIPGTGYASLTVSDGASGVLFQSISETWNAGATSALVTFAPGLPRSSGSALTPLGVPIRLDATGTLSQRACQGSIPSDFWVMPSMQLSIDGAAENGVSSLVIGEARLIIGVP